MSWIAWLLIGVIIGMIAMYYMMRRKIGDDYEIRKPKIKGRNNRLQNIFTKKDKQ